MSLHFSTVVTFAASWTLHVVRSGGLFLTTARFIVVRTITGFSLSLTVSIFAVVIKFPQEAGYELARLNLQLS